MISIVQLDLTGLTILIPTKDIQSCTFVTGLTPVGAVGNFSRNGRSMLPSATRGHLISASATAHPRERIDME